MIIDYTSYPFLAGLDKTINLRWPGLKLRDILSSEESPVRERLFRLLESIITRNRIPNPGSVTSDEEILSYYSLLVVAKLLNDKKLLAKIAVTYSKHAGYKLRGEPVNTLVEIAKLLGLRTGLSLNPPKIPVDIRRNTLIFKPKPLMIKLEDYLKHTKRLVSDPKYMLVNQIIHNGYVYLDKETYTRIIQEAINNHILETYEKLEINPEEYKFLIQDINKILEKTGWYKKQIELREFEEKTSGVIDPESFPPCIKKLINRLTNGENLGHHERFTIAAFLARIGMDVDSILELFKHAPDFNEKIARYQIEHIAGLRGSRKKYLPYNCDTMKSYGLCPIDGYCSGGKNPLTVYKKNLWRKINNKRVKKEKRESNEMQK